MPNFLTLVQNSIMGTPGTIGSITVSMGSINTDLDIETVRGFAYEILKAEEFSIHSLPVPCEGSFEWLEQGDARCLAVDLEANKAALRELIY